MERLQRSWGWAYGLVFVAMGGVTLVNGLWVSWIGYWSVALVFLLAVMALACVIPLYPALFAAAMSTLCWNVFFIPPVFDVQILDVQDLLMCCTYFLVALLITALTRRIRAQEERVLQREQRLSSLYQFSQRLVTATDQATLLQAAKAEIAQVLDAEVQILLSPWEGDVPFSEDVSRIRKIALTTPEKDYGYLWVHKREPWQQGQQSFLEIVSRHLALALEREGLRAMANQHALHHLSERLYDTLLDSVSHELRTPLTTIQCVLANLQEPHILEQSHWRQSLLDDLASASLRLDHLVANLLDMSRLQSGRFQLHRAWCDPLDIVQSVLKALQHELKDYTVQVKTPGPLPPLHVDYGLFEQALFNVVHNACTHNTPGTQITLSCAVEASQFVVRVEDQGKGIPEGQWDALFEKFYRLPDSDAPGTGLGLSIAQGFMLAHGGEIRVCNLKSGGASFTLALPLAPMPKLPLEVDDATTHSRG